MRVHIGEGRPAGKYRSLLSRPRFSGNPSQIRVFQIPAQSREIDNVSRKAIFLIMTFYVILPLTFGAAIYTFWRKPTLLVFSWYRGIGLYPAIKQLRHLATPVYHLIPKWIIFSLPDGLWVYAWTAFMASVWYNSDSRSISRLWVFSGVALGVGSELSQLLGWIPGTFDIGDLLFYVLSFFAALETTRWMLDRKKLLNERVLPL